MGLERPRGCRSSGIKSFFMWLKLDENLLIDSGLENSLKSSSEDAVDFLGCG